MSKKLLLADDSITIQKVIGITFSSDEYDLNVVDNGDAALEKARAERPDLVLADVFMPGKNGYELCTAIKEDSSLKDVPVLLLTGTFEPFDKDKAVSCGADSWIAKPFESQSLIELVEKLISEAASRESLPEQKGLEAELNAFASGEPALAAVEAEAPSGISETGKEEAFADPEEMEELDEEDILTLDEGDILEDEDLEILEADDNGEGVVLGEMPQEEDAFGGKEFEMDVDPFQDSDQDVDFSGMDDLTAGDSGQVSDEEAEISEFDEEFAFSLEDEPSEASGGSDEEEESFAAEGLEGIDESPWASTEKPADRGEAFEAEAAEEPQPEVAVQTESVPVESPRAEPAAASAAPEREVVERQVASLSEDELTRIVEKVAGSVIERLAGTLLEKIAWEVVPELSERLIKEEIRKIREGVQ